MCWQTDLEDTVEACIYNQEKQLRDFLLLNESSELKQKLRTWELNVLTYLVTPTYVFES